MESEGSSAAADSSARVRVLVVDDDPHVLKLLEAILGPAGLEVDSCLTGEEGLERALPGGYDVIVLDALLPGMSGLDVARELRRAGRTTPIIMLTGVTSTDFLVEALEAGADDFVRKPFNSRELKARIRASSRRGKVVPLVEVGGVRIDPLRRTLAMGQVEVRLTALEARILMELGAQSGEFVTREELLLAVWGIDFDPGTNLVYSHIANIRRKLEGSGLGHLIESTRGRGYRLAVS